jgi:hypothetical protein
MVFVFDVERALEAPESLDQLDQLNTGDWGTELHGAAFGETGTLFLHSSDPFADGAPDPESLGVYSLTERRLLSTAPLEQSMGTLMAVGPYLLDLLGHPKLVDPSTGRVLERWPELPTGNQGSSILHHIPRPPPIARDPAGRRIAVGTEKGIEILRFVV